MSITGSDLINRLESLVNLQTRAEVRKVDQAMANAMRADLAVHRAEQHAEEIFELLRRARREWTAARFASKRKPGVEEAIATMPRFEEFLLGALAPLGSFTIEDAFALYSKHGDLFEALVRQLNHARSKATHILAVLRPFKERYVAGWEREVDFFAGDEVRNKAHELKTRVISTSWDLDGWMNEVFDLFSRAAVYRGEIKINTQDREPVAAPREKMVPAGLISESSERIYRQRWVNWFDENREQLMSFIGEKLQTEPLPESPSSKVHFPDSQSLAKVSNGLFEQSNETGALNQPSEVTLEIESNSDGTISAQRSWVRREVAVKELGPWLAVLSMAWGKAGDSVIAKVKLLSGSGDSELVLPVMSLDDAKDRLTKVISTYS